ncbi:MAG TPA: DinB family protein [Leptospiraceae bacterium]|nr:DinB family protein [Leptospiraceae bacterium]HMW05146.1 DinB family protein [Leptospiraceae bacterium]HMX32593.1 DinB family protein [Leptospiraceae bacterium]HMY32485.1 DinB family protein [Leptospiraceae bacterium]HMZ66625.1 DinB family protein [Leptospiraceae bacterium]
MNEITVLLDQHKYIRSRLIQFIKEVAATPYAEEALHWSMPFGKGRAHIAWQIMHCAATYDRYLHFRILNAEPKNPDLVKAYGNGSVPNPKLIVKVEEILSALELTTKPYYNYFESLPIDKLNEKPHESADRTYKEILHLLNWHEASHHGQAQITWNAFRAFRGHI